MCVCVCVCGGNQKIDFTVPPACLTVVVCAFDIKVPVTNALRSVPMSPFSQVDGCQRVLSTSW